MKTIIYDDLVSKAEEEDVRIKIEAFNLGVESVLDEIIKAGVIKRWGEGRGLFPQKLPEREEEKHA